MKKHGKKTADTKKVKEKGFAHSVASAFPYTIPVMAGYLFIGFAFGVMFQEKGYNFLWAGLASLLIYAGSGQYLAVNFFLPGVSFLQIIFLEFMLNVRHIFFGLSMLERFGKMGKKRPYMIFSLTDETYSLFCLTKIPKDVDENTFMLAIAMMNQSYWIIGSMIGAVVGSAIAFNTTGIDFAMTALFVVIFVEQWLTSEKHLPALIGIGSALLCLIAFGQTNFILPSMACIAILLLSCKKIIEPKKEGEMSDAD